MQVVPYKIQVQNFPLHELMIKFGLYHLVELVLEIIIFCFDLV